MITLNISNASNEPQSSSPLLKKESTNETSISDLPPIITQEINDFKSLLETFDLEQMFAPFLPNTLQVARKRLFKKIESIMEDFPSVQKRKFQLIAMDVVDKQLFPEFLERVREPYKTLVWSKKYKVPLSVNVSELNDLKSLEEYQALCYKIAEWLLLAEISGDLMARAELYGFYSSKTKLKLSEIEQNYLLPKKSFDIVPHKVANMVVNNVIHVFSGILTPSQEAKADTKFSKLSSLAETVFGNEKIPWALLASGTSVAYITGGYLFTKVLSVARKHMNKAQKHEEIAKLNVLTQNMIEFVRSSNEDLEKILDCCLRSSSPEELEENSWDLDNKISQLIEYFSSGKVMENYKLLTEKNLSLKMLISKESNDGWVVCDLQELEEVNGEEDFVVCDFKK